MMNPATLDFDLGPNLEDALGEKLRLILVVEDDHAMRKLIHRALADDWRVEMAGSGEEALAFIAQEAPDIVLLDLGLPGMDGYEVCRRLKRMPGGERIHVIMVTEKSACEELEAALRVGGEDYVVKPFDPHELRSRVKLHCRLLAANDDALLIRRKAAWYHAELKQMSHARASELLATQDVAVFTLAKLAEMRDTDTGEHLLRIRAYCHRITEELQVNSRYAHRIDPRFLADLHRSSPLHDIGKVAIPDRILLKPGRLTPEEFGIMKTHAVVGAEVLEQAICSSSCGGFLRMAADIARHHHERFDGSGYPDGLKGEQIPLCARIVAIADVYDALTSKRPYKDAFDPHQAKRIIEQEAGKHFDPVIVEAFQNCFEDFLRIREMANTNEMAAFLEGPAPNRAHLCQGPTGSCEPSHGIYSRLADDEIYSELVEAYVAEMPDRIQALIETFASGDLTQLRRIVHQMKGAAGSYGFDPLTTPAARLEAAIDQNGSETDVQRCLDELISLCESLRAGSPG